MRTVGIIKHGQAGKNDGSRKRSKVYGAWEAMKSRCYNHNFHYFWRYGGRGIKVCEEWKNDFAAFYKYIGDPPSPQHTLDRYPNRDGNYEPGNVRWATPLEQVVNRDGKVLCDGRRVKDTEAAQMVSKSIHSVRYWSQFYSADVRDIANFVKQWRSNNTKRPNLSAHFPKRLDGDKHLRRATRVRLARAA